MIRVLRSRSVLHEAGLTIQNGARISLWWTTRLPKWDVQKDKTEKETKRKRWHGNWKRQMADCRWSINKWNVEVCFEFQDLRWNKNEFHDTEWFIYQIKTFHSFIYLVMIEFLVSFFIYGRGVHYIIDITLEW